MVSIESVTRSLYKAAFIAGATAGGGPAAGATAASFLASDAGEFAVNRAVQITLGSQNVDSGNFATGGFVTSPTLAMIGEAGPEMVVPMGSMMKPKRKPSAYNRRYAREYRRIKKMKTLKSGKMAKGFSGKRGHAKIVKLAHAAARKARRKK